MIHTIESGLPKKLYYFNTLLILFCVVTSANANILLGPKSSSSDLLNPSRSLDSNAFTTCPSNQIPFFRELQTDNYGSETSWSLTDIISNEVIL